MVNQGYVFLLQVNRNCWKTDFQLKDLTAGRVTFNTGL